MEVRVLFKGVLLTVDSLHFRGKVAYCYEKAEISWITDEEYLAVKATEAMFLVRHDEDQDWIILDENLCYAGSITDRQLSNAIYDDAYQTEADELYGDVD